MCILQYFVFFFAEIALHSLNTLRKTTIIVNSNIDYAQFRHKFLNFVTRIFKTEFMSFRIRTRNECPDISDLAIHKLLDFFTTYLCEAVFEN